MERKTRMMNRQHMICLVGGLALAPFNATALQAEQPADAPTRVAFHRTVATQVQPDPGMPEGQSSPTPPTPPTPPMKDDLFAGTEKFAKGASEANEVSMDPDDLSMVDPSHAGRARNMILNVVRHYEYERPGMYNMAEVDEFRHKLDGPEWHCSVHSRDLKSGESTDICSRNRPPDMIEKAIITVEPKELTFIHQIRRANGQGGHLFHDEDPGVSMVPGLPPELAFRLAPQMSAEWRAEMQAQMIASMAEFRAQMPHFQAELSDLQQRMPLHLELSQKDLQGIHFTMSHNQQLALNHELQHLRVDVQPALNEQLRHLKIDVQPALDEQLRHLKIDVQPALDAAGQQLMLLQQDLHDFQVPVPPVPPASEPPTAPAAPAAPEAPTAPDAPTAPTVPAVPAVPTPPAAPNAPAAPQAPTAPQAPSAPEAPTAPEAPNAPATPATPPAPTVPSTPHF